MTLLRLHWPQLLKCMGLVLVFNVTDYMLLTYMPSYLSFTMGYAESKGLLLIILVMLVMMPLNIVGGMFSDKLGRRPMIIGACIALFALAIPCLLLIGSGNDGLIFAGLMLLGLALVCFTSSMPSTLPALFYMPVRYSALSIGFNVSVSLFGGTTPLVTAWLVERTGDPLVPAYYLMGAAAIGLLTMLFVRETAGLPLRGSPPAVASDAEARTVAGRQPGDSGCAVAGQHRIVDGPAAYGMSDRRRSHDRRLLRQAHVALSQPRVAWCAGRDAHDGTARRGQLDAVRRPASLKMTAMRANRRSRAAAWQFA